MVCPAQSLPAQHAEGRPVEALPSMGCAALLQGQRAGLCVNPHEDSQGGSPAGGSPHPEHGRGDCVRPALGSEWGHIHSRGLVPSWRQWHGWLTPKGAVTHARDGPGCVPTSVEAVLPHSAPPGPGRTLRALAHARLPPSRRRCCPEPRPLQPGVLGPGHAACLWGSFAGCGLAACPRLEGAALPWTPAQGLGCRCMPHTPHRRVAAQSLASPWTPRAPPPPKRGGGGWVLWRAGRAAWSCPDRRGMWGPQRLRERAGGGGRGRVSRWQGLEPGSVCLGSGPPAAAGLRVARQGTQLRLCLVTAPTPW